MSFNDALSFVYLLYDPLRGRLLSIEDNVQTGDCPTFNTGLSSARLQVSISSDALCSQAGIQWNAEIFFLRIQKIEKLF
jgi:hypothetical protein